MMLYTKSSKLRVLTIIGSFSLPMQNILINIYSNLLSRFFPLYIQFLFMFQTPGFIIWNISFDTLSYQNAPLFLIYQVRPELVLLKV